MAEALDLMLSARGAAWMAPLVLVVGLHFLAEPARWRLYLAHGVEGGLPRLVHIFSLTAFIGYTMPLKMGLPVRIWLLRARAGVSLARISSVLVLDGLLYYAAWGLAACATLLVFAPHLTLSPEVTRATRVAAVALLLGLGVWLAWSRGEGGAARGGRFAPLWARIAAFRAAARETDLRALAGGAVIAALDIGSHVLRHGVLLAICGVSLDPGALALVACVSVFVGLVSLMPMGLGGYDVTLVLLLARLGVPTEVAVMVAVLNRLATIAVGSGLGIWGGFALGLNPLRREWAKRLKNV